jgi:Flp pilus assembly protein TadG
MRLRRGRVRGQALVEFAIVMPLFALLLFGLLDFGRVVFAQNSVTQAAREASRVAVLEPSASSDKYAAIRSAAKRMAPGLGLADADITGSSCADCFYATTTSSGGHVVVTVSKHIDLLTPLLSQVVGGSWVVESTSHGYIQ